MASITTTLTNLTSMTSITGKATGRGIKTEPLQAGYAASTPAYGVHHLSPGWALRARKAAGEV
jgi:hypothetical protein